MSISIAKQLMQGQRCRIHFVSLVAKVIYCSLSR